MNPLRNIVIIAVLFSGEIVAACPYQAQIETAAETSGIPGNVAVAIVQAESSCRSGVTGPGNERGLFQIGESTWRRVSKRPWSEAFNPAANIEAGIAHLKLARSVDPRNLVCWHNSGRRNWKELSPKWSTNHPNRIYRAIYRKGTP